MTQPSIDPLDEILMHLYMNARFEEFGGHPSSETKLADEAKAAINAHYISRERVLEALKKRHKDYMVDTPNLSSSSQRRQKSINFGFNAAIDAIKKELNL